MKKVLYPLVYILCDILSAVLATVCAWALRSNLRLEGVVTLENLAAFAFMSAGIVILCGFIFGIYYSEWQYIGFEELIRIGFSVVILFCADLVLQQLSTRGSLLEPYTMFTKSIIAAFAAIMLLLLMATRCIPRAYRWAMLTLFSKKNCQRAIIIGAGSTGATVVRQLKNDASFGVVPVAFLDRDPAKVGMHINGVKVFGTLDRLQSIIEHCWATTIIISLHNIPEQEMNELVRVCKATGLSVKVYQDFCDADRRKAVLKDFTIEDLLFRSMVQPDMQDVKDFVCGKTVLVTGGAGSIGSEICRQVLSFGCERLCIFDIHENGLFEINEELKGNYAGRYDLRLGSIRDKKRLDDVLSEQHFDIVIHAAAHKHVPMMEINPIEAVKNNIFGTRNLILSCTEHGVSRFVQISTDKAVHPKNIMGATKRVCELLVKAYNGVGGCEMCAVRFGNVLGSNGSVIPVFRRQIAAGGPVTVTHKDITRFFMTIPEAVSLVLCAGKRAKGGEIFVLNMEKPIRIYDLAVNMIRLSGLRLDQDIKIEVTGLRPGEKLYEELSFDSEQVSATDHSRIFVINDDGCYAREQLEEFIPRLTVQLADEADSGAVCDTVFALIGENICENGNDSSKLYAPISIS